MTSGYQIVPVAGKFSWSVFNGDGREAGMAPSREQAMAEIQAASERLNIAPVQLTPKAKVDIERIYHWTDRARATAAAVAERPETSKPTSADLYRVVRLLDNVLKEIDG